MEKQPKTKKRLWVILAIFITAIIAVWCIFIFVYIIKPVQNSWSKAADSETQESRNHAKEEKRKEEALAYLEERYGEEFEIESYRGMSYAYDYVQMYAYPKGYSDEAHQFQIQGRRNEEGKMEYVDSYVMVKLSDDYAACVDEIIDEYFDDYKFYLEFDSEWMTNNLPPDTKVEDLFELRANVDYPLPRLDILMKSSQQKNFTERNIMDMGNRLATWGYRGEVNLCYYLDDTYYEKKNEKNRRDCLEGEKSRREYHRIFVRDKETIDYR